MTYAIYYQRINPQGRTTLLHTWYFTGYVGQQAAFRRAVCAYQDKLQASYNGLFRFTLQEWNGYVIPPRNL